MKNAPRYSVFQFLLKKNYISSFLGHILRYTWDGQEKRDYSLDLKRIPFCTDQQVLKAVPLSDKGVFVAKIAYSPLIGGYAVVFNDGRAAFLFSSTVNFDPNVRLFQIIVTLWLFIKQNHAILYKTLERSYA